MHTYRKMVNNIHRDLGIPVNYENAFGLLLQIEETELAEIGDDIYGRLQMLFPAAAYAWEKMKTRAEKDGVVLNVVSAFRSVERQKEIIEQKIKSGQPIAQILQVCAAPGYSEHHTGRALDLTSPGCEPLSVTFEHTEAFRWLVENAALYSFSLSYPKDNNAGISYEPWHWAYN